MLSDSDWENIMKITFLSCLSTAINSLLGLVSVRLRTNKYHLPHPMRITSAILILLISILIFVGKIHGVDNRAYREEKIITETVINLSSIQVVFDFNCFKDCLVGIRYYSGSSFEFIRDQPSEISGILSNGVHFRCIENVNDGNSILVHGLITVN